MELEKLCGTQTQHCPVWSEWGAALRVPMQELVPAPRREFKVLCASNKRKGRASWALSHRQAEWLCPDPTLAVDNLSNGACTWSCLWSDRGVAGSARSCTGQKGSRTSQVLRCAHISLTQREGQQSCWGLQMQAHKAPLHRPSWDHRQFKQQGTPRAQQVAPCTPGNPTHIIKARKQAQSKPPHPEHTPSAQVTHQAGTAHTCPNYSLPARTMQYAVYSETTLLRLLNPTPRRKHKDKQNGETEGCAPNEGTR